MQAMKQLWAAASGEEDEVMGDLHIIDRFVTTS